MSTMYRNDPTLSAARFPRHSIRHAVILATRAGEPNRWTHYVSQDGYGFRSRMFARSDYNVMRDVASMRRFEVTPAQISLGMKWRATMADDTAPRQFCDRGTK